MPVALIIMGGFIVDMIRGCVAEGSQAGRIKAILEGDQVLDFL